MDIWAIIPPARYQQRHRSDPHPREQHRQSGENKVEQIQAVGEQIAN